MFKQILIIITIIILTYFIFKFIFTANHKIYLSNETIKYKMSDRDKDFLKMYSSDSLLENLTSDVNLFYTNESWSTKNNNYIFFNEKYYIVEPGYYYYLRKDQITINNKNTNIKLFDKNKLKKINSKN
jgi:hypothetical protein